VQAIKRVGCFMNAQVEVELRGVGQLLVEEVNLDMVLLWTLINFCCMVTLSRGKIVLVTLVLLWSLRQ
jgi:hypothetical protein